MSEKLSQNLSQDPDLAEKNRIALEQDAAFKRSRRGLELYMSALSQQAPYNELRPATYPQDEIAAAGMDIKEGKRQERAEQIRQQAYRAQGWQGSYPRDTQTEVEALDHAQQLSTIDAYAMPPLYTTDDQPDRPEYISSGSEKFRRRTGLKSTISLDHARKEFVDIVQRAMKEEYNRTYPDEQPMDTRGSIGYYITPSEAERLKSAGITFAETAKKLDEGEARTPEQQQAQRDDNRFANEYYKNEFIPRPVGESTFWKTPEDHNERIVRGDVDREIKYYDEEIDRFTRIRDIREVKVLQAERQEALRTSYVGVKVKNADGTPVAAPQEKKPH